MKPAQLLGATALLSTLALLPAAAHAQAAPNAGAPSQQNTPQSAVPSTNATSNEEEQQQSASADGLKTEDNTVVVTGSRIRRPETDGVLPGVQVTAQSIETRGFTNALEALNDIPLVGPGASPLNGNNGGQTASLGAAFVDLLDLGTARTLTLVNGRRFVSGNSASLFVAGNETGSQVDVNVIPSTLIERIDIVTVGGAAAYGADAIAGVVNYILKDDYEGLQLRGLAGVSERGDAGQYQLSALAGHNFMDGRANLTLSFEYDRNDGVQATSRDFRNARPGSYTNPFNGGIRNGAFAPNAVIDVANLNNGAFLRATDDGQPSSLFGLGLVTQTLSYAGTVLLPTSNTFYTPYTPITTGTGANLRTTNYITLQNGVGTNGFVVPATNAAGARTTLTTLNNTFFNSAAQIIPGTPGATLISTNGLNGAATAPTGVPITTFAPTSLPTINFAQVFTQTGRTNPFTAPNRANFAGDAAGTAAFNAAVATYNSRSSSAAVLATIGANVIPQGTGVTDAAYTAQLTTLAINALQANRFTAREFLAANPGTNLNYFIGTFDPYVPRVANTDTTPVSVKVNGATTLVPVNQVLPFVAVPLEFNPDGSLRSYNFTGPVSGNDPLTAASARGGDGGFRRSLENTVLRTQQDRYVANLNGKIDLTDQVTFFTENTYANVLNRSLGNVGSQNFVTNAGQENAPLLVNYNNPFLSAQNRAVLTSVGITPTAANQGNFVVTRQNQDIFGTNPFTNRQETYRLVSGLRSKFELFGQSWNAEISGSYGNSKQNTRSYNIKDVEYQLALDAVDAGQATTGVANGNIVCRAKLFPQQYLGRTPIGTQENITRVNGADGLPTEILTTPVISQAQIDSCQPLNPFGFNNMSEASKAYVTAPVYFRNVSQQIYAQANVGGGLFNLPAGLLSINVNGEYRRDQLEFTSDQINILGRTRTAPSANTSAHTETYEVGGEAAIPITGPDFAGFLGRIELRPAVRVTQQSGQAATFRNLAGQVITPKASGKAATIYSLAGTWAPIRDIQFRGNYTRSVRQPSIVELFLGGQPSFTAVTDLCGPASIDTGIAPASRRANCAAAAIANGNATDAASAATFLQSFTPQGGSLSGTFSGVSTLQPERGRSWTAGGVLTPRFIPGLSLSADYIAVRVDNVISIAGVGTYVQACYDSPTFPDTTAQIGVNGCSRFSRDGNFQLQSGYQGGFLNLGGLDVRAINMSGNYTFRFGSDRLVLRGNAYKLIRYNTSNSGKFDDTQTFAGTFAEPRWKTQLSARYEVEKGYAQVTWNRTDPTRIYSGNTAAGGEVYPYNLYPSQNNVDVALGVDVNQKFRMQFNVSNLLDNTAAGDLGYRFGAYLDQIGRRYQVAVTTRF